MHARVAITTFLLPLSALAWQPDSTDSSQSSEPSSSSTSSSSSSSTSCDKWATVANDLKSNFVSNYGCTDYARGAIRLVFHDCFNGACDGSILLSNECQRSENNGLQETCAFMKQKGEQYGVGMADLIQLGGAIGVAACPGGPAISFKAGRHDSSTPAPEGLLPNRNDNAQKQISMFQARGFDSSELVALVGAHTAAKVNGGRGPPLDTSPGRWDTTFYPDTADGTAPESLNSDKALAKYGQTKDVWSKFGADAGAWAGLFVPAMEKLGLLGVDASSLYDCSSVVSGA